MDLLLIELEETAVDHRFGIFTSNVLYGALIAIQYNDLNI